MNDSFKIDLYPTTFKWLESVISDLDQAKENYPNGLGCMIYVTTLGFTPITILIDIYIGIVEAAFYVIGQHDYQRALFTLKKKWIEAPVQEAAFIVIGVISMVTELGHWQRSYHITKGLIQNLSERLNLGTPHIFNHIRYSIPNDRLPLPATCQTQFERFDFDIYNTKRNKFHMNLNEFKRNYSADDIISSVCKIYGANHVFQRILVARTATEVMALNLVSLKEKEVRKRLDDIRDCFALHYHNHIVASGLQVIISAHHVLLAYLTLPIYIRKEIKDP